MTKDERTQVSDSDRHEAKEPARRKVKVTDRRHTASVADASAPETVKASVSAPGVDRRGGSSTSEASGRSKAPPAEGDPRTLETPSAEGELGPPDDVAVAREEAAKLREHLQRLAADFDNYRKRMLKEQTRAVELASEPLVRRLLEVLDEFDLALMAAEQRPDFDTFLHGVELVYAKLLETLRAEGLERMDAEGKPFDPMLHEALMQSGDAEGDPIVADTLRSGYTLRGRVIRPAGVKVVRK